MPIKFETKLKLRIMNTIKFKFALVILLCIGLGTTIAAQDLRIYYAKHDRPKIENLIGLEFDLDGSKDNIKPLVVYSGIKDKDEQQLNIEYNIEGEGTKNDGKYDENDIELEDVKEDTEPEKEELLIRGSVVMNDPNIRLYPIPANNYIDFVSIEDQFHTIEVLDITGKVNLKIDLNSINNRINLENLSSGIYLIQFVGDTKISTKRITIRK